MLSYWEYKKTIFIHTQNIFSGNVRGFREHLLYMEQVMVSDATDGSINKLKFIKNRYGGVGVYEEYEHSISDFFELIPQCDNMRFVMVENGIFYPSIVIPQQIISVEKFVTSISKSVIDKENGVNRNEH